MTDTEKELRACLEGLVSRTGEPHLAKAWPMFWKRIQAVLAKTEDA